MGLVEDKLVFEIDKPITLLSDQKIENKQITLIVNNLNDQPVEVNEPSFLTPMEADDPFSSSMVVGGDPRVPDRMHITPKVGSKNGKIKLESGVNRLEYILSGKAPVTGQKNTSIKVFFANKILNIDLKLDPVEDKLSLEMDNPNDIVLLSDQNIESKKIKLVVNNSNGEPIEVNGPNFSFPKGMRITSKSDFKDGKIKLENGKNSLEYILSGKAPVTGQKNTSIKVFFANKILNIDLKLDPVEDKLSLEIALLLYF